MPIVQISLVQGRDEATLKRLVKEVARTVHTSIGAPLSTVRVIVHQVPAALWAIGDETRDDIDAAKAAAAATAASTTANTSSTTKATT
jgi:4-oxalocrotonate tautomerase